MGVGRVDLKLPHMERIRYLFRPVIGWEAAGLRFSELGAHPLDD